jgi:hypothetical protein
MSVDRPLNAVQLAVVLGCPEALAVTVAVQAAVAICMNNPLHFSGRTTDLH